MDKKKLDEITADADLWDSRQLGASSEHVRIVSDEEAKDIDEGLGLQLISMRLSKALIEQFKGLSKLAGLGYQPLMRQVLTQYAQDNAHKLDSLLTAAEAAERAEKLFTQAIKYKEVIAALAPLSGERISAERDYSAALGGANALFRQAHEHCKDQVLKNHAQLRMDQILALCQQEMPAIHKKKYGKAV